jgi:hypothetical protein
MPQDLLHRVQHATAFDQKCGVRVAQVVDAQVTEVKSISDGDKVRHDFSINAN